MNQYTIRNRYMLQKLMIVLFLLLESPPNCVGRYNRMLTTDNSGIILDCRCEGLLPVLNEVFSYKANLM